MMKAKKKKPPVMDGKVSEAIATHTVESARVIAEIAKRVMREEVLPVDLATAGITMVPKKQSSLVDVRDYRPIACQSHVSKVMEAPVTKTIVDNWQPNEGQDGFTAGNGPEIAAIIIYEQSAKKPSKWLVGLDLVRAFDIAYVDTIVHQIGHLPINES